MWMDVNVTVGQVNGDGIYLNFGDSIKPIWRRIPFKRVRQIEILSLATIITQVKYGWLRHNKMLNFGRNNNWTDKYKVVEIEAGKMAIPITENVR